jgi:hypothetical protein
MALGTCPWPMLGQDSSPAYLAQNEAVWQGKRSPLGKHPLGAWLLSEELWQKAPTLANTLLTAPHASVRHYVGQPLQLARLRLAGLVEAKHPYYWANTTQGNLAWRSSARPAWVTLADTPATVGSLPELMHLSLTETSNSLPLTELLPPTLYPQWVDVCHAWLAWYETHQHSPTLTVLPNEAAAKALSQWWQRRQPAHQQTLLSVVWPRLPLQQQASMLNEWLKASHPLPLGEDRVRVTHFTKTKQAGEPHHLLIIGPEALHPTLWAWEQYPSLATLPLQVNLLYDRPPYTPCTALAAWQARHPHWVVCQRVAKA